MTGVVLRYEGTVGGFQRALREVRKAGMQGQKLGDERAMRRLQRKLRREMTRDLIGQILNRKGGEAA